MRFANNFNPEWGYLAPAPSFTRTARIVLVAAAIGASAGGAVVFSLVEHPAAEETSVAARTLVQPAALHMNGAPAAATTQSPLPGTHADTARPADGSSAMLSSAHAAGPAASEAGTSATVQEPANIAGLAEAPAATDPPPAAALNDAAATPIAQKKPARKQALSSRSGPQPYGGIARGPLALLRSLTMPGAAGASQWHGEY